MARKTKQDVLLSYDFLPIFEKLIEKGKSFAAAELTVAIIKYDKEGTEPSFADESVSFVWESVIKPKLDENKKAYEEVAKIRKEVGRSGGLAKAENSSNDNQNVPNVPNGNFGNERNQNYQTYQNVHDNDNDNDNDNVYVNDNVNDKKKNNKKEKEPRHKYGQYQNVLLSDSDLMKLQAEFPNDWQEWIEKVSEYCKGHGKSYTDYLATIRNWARREKNKPVYNPNARNDVLTGYEQAMRLLGVEESG